MHPYEAILKKSGGKMEAAMKKRGIILQGIDWVTFIMDLIAKFLDCGASSAKEALASNPRWSRALIMLSLQRHSERRIPLLALRTATDAVIEEIEGATDDDLKALVGE